jgi:hypothetical protein
MYILQVDPWSTISAIRPKVMHGHQYVMQPKNILEK